MRQAEIEQLIRDDKAYVWHPFTQMREWIDETPVIIERASGNYLYDIHGRAYLDGVSSLWTNVHGHGRPELDRAVRDQLDLVAHSTMLGLANAPAIQCAALLARAAPAGLTKVFFSDNGSTAVEAALKMAFQHAGRTGSGNRRRTRFMTLANAYHGDTIGSVSLGGIELFHSLYRPLLFETLQAPSPYCYRCSRDKRFPGCGYDCLNEMEDLMRAHADTLCALVIEPLVQGAAGVIVQPPGYLRQVRSLCTRYGLLMIADEVAVGFGKTGCLFACQKEGVTPDLMALAKGLSGGYLPLAATLATEEIFESFLGRHEEFKTFFHGHTYTGNPLACAVARANLELFASGGVIERLPAVIDHMAAALAGLRDLPHVGDIRQCGIMAGIELVADKEAKAPYRPEEMIGRRVIAAARELGVILRPLGDVIVLMPPLSVTIEQTAELVAVAAAAIAAVTGAR